jgi:hypothetical protein
MRTMWEIKVSALARLTHPEEEVEDRHPDDGDGEPEYTLPTDHLDRGDGMFRHDEFLEDKLCGGKELGKGNQQHTNDNPHGIRRRPTLWRRRGMIIQRSRKS